MYHDKSIAESLRRYSHINGLSAGRSVAMRWQEQLRTMYEEANPSEKIAIVVLLDGLDDFLSGGEAIDVVEFGPDRPVKRTRRHSWVNTVFQGIKR